MASYSERSGMILFKFCEVCSNKFFVRDLDKYRRQFTCSRTCGSERRRRTLIASRVEVDQPIDYRVIKAANGSLFKVSIEDYEYASSIPWSIKGDGYVCASYGVVLHREIMRRVYGDFGKLEVDHINSDRADSRRENLRIVTSNQNGYNRSSFAGAASRYKGVQPSNKKWRVAIKADGKHFYLGVFEDEAYAGYMYDQWALELHGEYARLNFEYSEILA
ncbi:hypothetical protein B5P43_18265 [Bacillus sp. SRB_336]|nr:hypothetical protein B5P43_18265 [Bacillus sp. SRB_336]